MIGFAFCVSLKGNTVEFKPYHMGWHFGMEMAFGGRIYLGLVGVMVQVRHDRAGGAHGKGTELGYCACISAFTHGGDCLGDGSRIQRSIVSNNRY